MAQVEFNVILTSFWYLDTLARVEFSRETEIDNFNLVTVRRDTEYVFGFDVEMQNGPRMDVRNTLADLTHEMNTFTFR